MRRVAFLCKRGKAEGHGTGPNGPRGRNQRAMGLEPIGNGPGQGTGGRYRSARSRCCRNKATGNAGVRVRAGAARSRLPQNKKRSLARWLNSVSAVRTRLELATPGVTGRYSKPTELPHQLSVNFPFGIAKVQLKFDSANILKEFNEKNVRPRRVGHFQRVWGRGRSLAGRFT